MKDIIKTIIIKMQARFPLTLISRNTSLPVDSGKIITVTGIRRCGKSYTMYETINSLMQKGIAREKILFINFDDERLQFNPGNLDLILQAYRELYPDISLADIYIFFDEIQMAQGWEPFVRRIYDTENRNIFLTGSNAKLLSSEIATSLRGRTLPFEVFPLSFDEYCRFTQTDTNWLLPENRSLIENGFSRFLTKGGFPELVLTGYQYFENTIQEYYHVMLYKDLIERYGIRNIPVLKYLVSRLIAGLGKPVSINKMNNELKSAGIKSDKNLLYTLVEYLQSIYFIQRIGKFDLSVIKSELSSEKKIYFTDNGFLTSLSFSYGNDYGRLLENLVFLWFRKQFPFGRGISFAKGKKECDFVIFDRDKPVLLSQVCWNLNQPETLRREMEGLNEQAKYLNCDKLWIITSGEEQVLETGAIQTTVVPAWKLMMENRTLL